MAVLMIRKHQRFAVRQSACLEWAEQSYCVGMVVEVSLDGCRFSMTDNAELAIGLAVTPGPVTLRIDGFMNRGAQVRWADENRIGLLFDQPLHNAEIAELLQDRRSESASQPMRSYGT
jgi:hypothetical protein